jgi:septin 7
MSHEESRPSEVPTDAALVSGTPKDDNLEDGFWAPQKPASPNVLHLRRELIARLTNLYLATNGQLSNAPRASPVPQSGPPVPNGKPTSPYNERQNPMIPNAQIAAQTVSSKDPKAAAQAASDMRNVVRRKLTGYVGFANLPNQWHRKSVRKGFNFNVMVVGK